MGGWHHHLNGHEFEQNLENSRQGSLVCCSLWGCKELDTTELLNNNNNNKHAESSLTYLKAIQGKEFPRNSTKGKDCCMCIKGKQDLLLTIKLNWGPICLVSPGLGN